MLSSLDLTVIDERSFYRALLFAYRPAKPRRIWSEDYFQLANRCLGGAIGVAIAANISAEQIIGQSGQALLSVSPLPLMSGKRRRC